MSEINKKIRCAIYTRKSTSEGLTSELNSLEVQRLAAENYIKSQQSLGWYCLAEQYNDGGYTGANMERPALAMLMNDIKGGRIDCLVVYKVDRLSRSLLDFARIITLLDTYKVSFVSVTQDFNTATSMGRLTLNILLSFAQFEREIISERTRDKIAASRKQGRWTGGRPVLGYNISANGGHLEINESEAQQVRHIFDLYLQTGSLLKTCKSVEFLGWKTKKWTFRNGHEQLSRPFDKKNIQYLLKNILYTGRLRYQNQIYEGKHQRIVSDEIWETVQAMRNKHRRSHTVPVHDQSFFVLSGILKCSQCGSLMAPTHCKKGDRRYRYYRCNTKSNFGAEKCQQPSISASEIEHFIVQNILEYLTDQREGRFFFEYAGNEHMPNKASDWDTLTTKEKYVVLQRIIQRIEFDGIDGRIKIYFQEYLSDRRNKSHPLKNNLLELRFHFVTKSHGQKQMISGIEKQIAPEMKGRIPRITRLLALAIHFDKSVHTQKNSNFAVIARENQITRARMSQIISLTNLAPDIQQDILFLPRSETGRDKLILSTILPIAKEPDWMVQRQLWKHLFSENLLTPTTQ